MKNETRYFRIRFPKGVGANLFEGNLLLSWPENKTGVLLRCLLAAAAKVSKVIR